MVRTIIHGARIGGGGREVSKWSHGAFSVERRNIVLSAGMPFSRGNLNFLHQKTSEIHLNLRR